MTVYNSGEKFYEHYRTSYLHIEGVVDAGYEFGPHRYADGLEAPSSDVKVRSGNPTLKDMQQAALSVGIRSTDKIFTVWAATLKSTTSDGTLIVPVENDKLIVAGITWLIIWCKTVLYGAQYVCYCQLSSATNVQEQSTFTGRVDD